MRELADHAIRRMRQPNAFKHLVDQTPAALAGLQAACGQPDVFAHAQAIEHAGHLSLDADSEARDLMRMRARNVVPPEQNLAMARLELTCQHLEECAFSCTVRTDQ